LHELLERVDFEDVKRAASFEEWLERTQYLLQSVSDQHGIDETGRDHAASLVWYALTRPLPIPASGKTLRISNCSRKLVELAFHLPIPEDHHPALGMPATSKTWQIERGYLQGSIDLLFEYEAPEPLAQKRIYLVDWKSNRLDNYQPKTLAATVQEHYALQVKIYTLATAHWLGIQTAEEWKQRFGGVLYVFLRGMPHGPAVDFQQPTWAQVQGIRDTLQSRAY
jgi:exodeoxyribonuclease V beta subunit